MRSAVLLAAALLLGASAVQAAPPAARLAGPQDVAGRLREPDLVILHAGGDADFAAGHIPGARLAGRGALTAPSAPGGLVLELPSEPELRAQLEQLGVTPRSRIVVYAGGGEVQSATRLMWTLDAAGLGGRAVLLDGGLAAWKAAGRPLETGPATALTPGKLPALKLRPRLVTADQVTARADGLKVIDARAPAFYEGLQPGFGVDAAKKGHIAGAVSVPFSSVTGGDQRFKSPDELRALFAKAGVKPGDKVAVYCHVGQQATAVEFAAWRAGIDARLYDGSFQDWARRGGAIETSAPAR